MYATLGALVVGGMGFSLSVQSGCETNERQTRSLSDDLRAKASPQLSRQQKAKNRANTSTARTTTDCHFRDLPPRQIPAGKMAHLPQTGSMPPVQQRSSSSGASRAPDSSEWKRRIGRGAGRFQLQLHVG
jgi:hypothetical protein